MHSSKAWKLLEKFYIGDLATGDAQAVAVEVSDSKPREGPPVTLDPSKYVSLPLVRKDIISPDTRLFRSQATQRWYRGCTG